MYTGFFNLAHAPFSIAPDPRFLFMSERHREALAHLLYGVKSGGGFVLLTGEIGAGKTTICRCFLEQIPENCNVGYIFNPKLTVNELLQSICQEFHVSCENNAAEPASIKGYVDALNAFLLVAHANGRHNVLIIDEAQSLSTEVLEQLRLLTNLETNEHKLLQIILIGQPELRVILEKIELRQLAQRVIARYHLDALSSGETARYVLHRLAIAGTGTATPLPHALMNSIHRLTQGVPRRINLLCDRALLGAYAEGKTLVSRRILYKASGEIFGDEKHVILRSPTPWRFAALGLLSGATIAAAVFLTVVPIPQALPMRVAETPLTAKLATPASATIASNSVAAPLLSATVNASLTAPQNFRTSYNLNKAPNTDSTDVEWAYRRLARLWGKSPASGDPCQTMARVNLRCYQSNKGFAELRQLDRPAILSLRDQANHIYYALITGLTDTQANLLIDGATYPFNLIALAHHFQGDFMTIWRVPSGYREKIHIGDQGEDVDWIVSNLAKLNGTPTSSAKQGKQAFDSATIRQIREFQAAQGLEVDGVVGPKTVMLLNHATSSTEPRLHHSQAVTPESSRK
jgi:general secretion pathway protein A